MNCLICGKKFIDNTPNHNKKYCSYQCYIMARYQREAALNNLSGDVFRQVAAISTLKEATRKGLMTEEELANRLQNLKIKSLIEKYQKVENDNQKIKNG